MIPTLQGIIMVEMRRVELLSNNSSIQISPSTVCYLSSLKVRKQTYSLLGIYINTLYSLQKKIDLFPTILSPYSKTWVLMIRRRHNLRQRMLIYCYQRLYLFLLFYSGQSNHPLLAICTSKLLSKPITSPYTLLLYTIFLKYTIFFYILLASCFSLCYYNVCNTQGYSVNGQHDGLQNHKSEFESQYPCQVKIRTFSSNLFLSQN